MVLSLDSSIFTAKPRLSNPLINNSLRPPKLFIKISCKACGNERSNFYKVLSLSSSNARIDEIKSAYRSMALKYHPDLCHPLMKEESTRMFLRVHEAYKTLSDPNSREEYDNEMSLSGFTQRDYKNEVKNQLVRKRWEDQVVELKRRSSFRNARKEGSWGSRLRALNRQI